MKSIKAATHPRVLSLVFVCVLVQSLVFLVQIGKSPFSVVLQMPIRMVCTCSDATVRLISPGSGACITTLLVPRMVTVRDTVYAAAECKSCHFPGGRGCTSKVIVSPRQWFL